MNLTTRYGHIPPKESMPLVNAHANFVVPLIYKEWQDMTRLFSSQRYTGEQAAYKIAVDLFEGYAEAFEGQEFDRNLIHYVHHGLDQYFIAALRNTTNIDTIANETADHNSMYRLHDRNVISVLEGTITNLASEAKNAKLVSKGNVSRIGLDAQSSILINRAEVNELGPSVSNSALINHGIASTYMLKKAKSSIGVNYKTAGVVGIHSDASVFINHGNLRNISGTFNGGVLISYTDISKEIEKPRRIVYNNPFYDQGPSHNFIFTQKKLARLEGEHPTESVIIDVRENELVTSMHGYSGDVSDFSKELNDIVTLADETKRFTENDFHAIFDFNWNELKKEIIALAEPMRYEMRT